MYGSGRCMPFNPDVHHRRSIRLPNYDYSIEGAYFVTICSFQKGCIFGEIQNEEVLLNSFGKTLEEEWYRVPLIRPEITLDKFVVMPNHVHGIRWINEAATSVGIGRTSRAPLQRKPRSLSSCMAQFKATVTYRIRAMAPEHTNVWQRNYYERVIRSERELDDIRRYIIENPIKWEMDEHHSDVGAHGLCAP